MPDWIALVTVDKEAETTHDDAITDRSSLLNPRLFGPTGLLDS